MVRFQFFPKTYIKVNHHITMNILKVIIAISPQHTSTEYYQRNVFNVPPHQHNPSENAKHSNATNQYTFGVESIKGSKYSQNIEEKSESKTAQTISKSNINQAKDTAPKTDKTKNIPKVKKNKKKDKSKKEEQVENKEGSKK